MKTVKIIAILRKTRRRTMNITSDKNLMMLHSTNADSEYKYYTYMLSKKDSHLVGYKKENIRYRIIKGAAKQKGLKLMENRRYTFSIILK